MADHSKMRLGVRPARPDQMRRRLRLTDYLFGALPAGPASVDWLAKVPSFPMYGNDTKGDCAIAAIGHMVQVWSANAGKPVTPLLDEILAVYKTLSPNDDGCVLIDVLNYWRQNPIAGVQIGAYVSVNFHSLMEYQAGLWLFGGLYSGVELPLAAQKQDSWDVSSGPGSEPDSWGGHCVPWGQCPGPATSRCVTWGATKDATWAWIQAYMSELYALISPDWFEDDGLAPSGFDMPSLQADLQLVTA